MKLSENFFYTLREDLRDEESISGNLLVKSGMFKKVGNGIYMKMPLGKKVAQNVEKIIREEMNNAGAKEVTMPMLLPVDLFEKSGRYAAFGPSIFKLNDRYDRPYVLGPTHEEFFVLAASMKSHSYKDFPYTLYQIGNKYRDEVRPRLGLIRTREFTMKDAYSFDTDLENLDKSYQKQFNAYNKICQRLGLNYVVVRADTGVMGGLLSEEFQAVTDVGEDILVLCDHCDYASNIEITPYVCNEIDNEEEKTIELVETGDCHTIEEVCELLKLDIKKTVKALLMNVDNELVVFFVRGDKELNEVKALKLLKGMEIGFADDELIATSNAVAGCTGLVGLNAKIVIDNEVLKMKNFCCGANKEGYHYINVNVKDFKYDAVGDIVNVQQGDKCPNCNEGHLVFKKGIEVGNTFKLGTKYSESLGLNYLDENNELKPVVMGCYGIGVERMIAAVVEQNHDDKGIIWPMSIAPYKVAIVLIDPKDEEQSKVANDLYNTLNSVGIDAILDDRKERPGVKFNDMDLIGIPVRITVGKKVNEGKVELKERMEAESTDINVDNIIGEVKNIVNK